jgi:hypothetical protein
MYLALFFKYRHLTMFNTKFNTNQFRKECLTLALLSFAMSSPAMAGDPSGIPSYLILRTDAPSESGQGDRLQMNSTKRPSYKSNPLWIEYQDRMKNRKIVAAKLKRAKFVSKDYSRMALNYRLNIDITNPMGINPWGNHYRRTRQYYYLPGRTYIPRSYIPVVASHGLRL